MGAHFPCGCFPRAQRMRRPGHFRSVERREVDVGDDGSQGTADIGEDRLEEASSPTQPFDKTPCYSPSNDGPMAQ